MTERMRELLGFLISMAALHDADMAKQFADELDLLFENSILCDAEPIGYFAYGEIGYGFAGIWEELAGPEYKGATPLYKAKGQP